MTAPSESPASYTLTNRRGSRAIVSNYGCALMTLEIADGAGNATDVVLGYDRPSDYAEDAYYLGIVAGRCAGRIASGYLDFCGQVHQLSVGAGGHHLHGGEAGLGQRIWQLGSAADDEIYFTYNSPDGEEGYPGELHCTVRYRLTDEDEFRVCYRAEASARTVFSPTQHSYFNLGGHSAGNILGHELRLDAADFVPLQPDLIPLGERRPVAGAVMDFREFRPIGDAIDARDAQLQLAGGYDHSWVLREQRSWEAEPVAEVREPVSGRQLAVYTDRPAVHFYSGNMLATGIVGKQDALYGPRQGFCLETQHLPTAVLDASGEGMEVSPDAPFESETRFSFSGFDRS